MKKLLPVMLILLALLSCLLPMQALAAADMTAYTPYELTAKEIPEDDTHPYGSALLTFKIHNLPRSSDTIHWSVLIEMKVGDADWVATNELSSDDCLDLYQTSTGVFAFEQLYLETYVWNGTNLISYRAFVRQYDYTWTGVGQSGYSNVASLGLISSTWAAPELNKADSLGLITDRLKGADLTKPITREEFAELAILLFEKVTATTAEINATNPFADTTNPEILKAYKMEITKGITTTTFEPNTLINREQCAAMLFRAIKAINPDGDYSTAGEKNFPDQKYISSWAVEATKYMSQIGIIKGDTAGNFMPKATTSAQEAAGYGMATREAAILMTVRSYEKLAA